MHQEFFDTLHKDHEEVAGILSQLEKSRGSTRKQHLQHLKQEILPHMRGEEAAFYPRLLEHEETKEDAQEGIKEHKEAQDTLETLMDMSENATEWMDTFHQLKEEIEHHVEEEEGKIFDGAREVISERQMESIMKEFQKQKDKEKLTIK